MRSNQPLEEIAGKLEIAACTQHGITEGEWTELQRLSTSKEQFIDMHVLNAILCDRSSGRRTAYIRIARKFLVERQHATKATALLVLDKLNDSSTVFWARKLESDPDSGVRAEAHLVLRKHSTSAITPDHPLARNRIGKFR